MPIVAIVIVFVLGVAGLVGVVSTPDPSLLHLLPLLGAVLAVPTAFVRDLFDTAADPATDGPDPSR